MANDFEKLAREAADTEAVLGSADEGDRSDGDSANNTDNVTRKRFEDQQEGREEGRVDSEPLHANQNRVDDRVNLLSTEFDQLSVGSPGHTLPSDVVAECAALVGGCGSDASDDLVPTQAMGLASAKAAPHMRTQASQVAPLPVASLLKLVADVGDAVELCSVVPSHISHVSLRTPPTDADIAQHVKRDLLKKNVNRTHTSGKLKRNEHKDREKRKLLASAKLSGFSGWY